MEASLSDMRRDVLGIVEQAEKPLNAKAIAEHLDPQPSLSTVYRALDHMERRGLVQSVAFFNGTRYYYGGNRDAQFILCRECHEIREFERCNAFEIRETLEREFDYRLSGHVLYFKGICPDCRVSLDKKARYR